MEKSRKPKIRFKGYNDDWEQRELGEIADFYTGNGLSWNDISENGSQECILYGNLYTDYGMIAENVVYRTNTVINTPVYSEFGDVLIPASDTTPTGLARATSIEKSGVLLGGDINIVRPKKSISGSYLSLAINRNKGELIKLIKGTTVRHIHNSEIKGVTVSLPNNLCEQEIITECFRNLDNLITLHQRKLEKLMNVKKSMLEKMFPKQGSTVPEIRFNGFTQAWEQRKAKKLFISTADKGYPDLPVLSATQDRGMIRRDQNSINISHDKNNENGYKRVLPGQFVIHLRSFQGGFAHSRIEGITSPAYTIFGFSEPKKHDSEYWKYVFTSKEFIRRLETVTYGIRDGRSISYDEFLTLDFFFPSVEEQEKISQYLDELTHLITLHQRKLEKLKNIKKSMLEKMFI